MCTYTRINNEPIAPTQWPSDHSFRPYAKANEQDIHEAEYNTAPNESLLQGRGQLRNNSAGHLGHHAVWLSRFYAGTSSRADDSEQASKTSDRGEQGKGTIICSDFIMKWKQGPYTDFCRTRQTLAQWPIYMSRKRTPGLDGPSNIRAPRNILPGCHNCTYLTRPPARLCPEPSKSL